MSVRCMGLVGCVSDTEFRHRAYNALRAQHGFVVQPFVVQPGFVVQPVLTVVQRLTTFRLTQRVARSLGLSLSFLYLTGPV